MNAEVAEASSLPHQPPAGGRPPTGPSAAKGNVPPPADVPSAAKIAPTPVAADVDKAAEKGVRAALATSGGPADEVVHNADIATIQAHLDAAKRTGQPPTLAISDTAHVEPGGSMEPKTTTDADGEGKLQRKGKADAGEGKARTTCATSAARGKEKAAENMEEESVGEGKSAKKGKETATEEKAAANMEEKSEGEGKGAKKGKEKAREKEKEKAAEKEKEMQKERRGHGIRHDSSGDGQGWVGEIKLVGANRYIVKSRDKMGLAYLHSIAYIVYDGFVSKVLMDELAVLEEAELERWRKVWEEVRILPTGMWTAIWARGAYLPKTRVDDILGKYREYKSSGDALHDALLPAIWFSIDADTKEGQEKSDAMMSALIGRVSMCAAFGKVAASVARKAGDTDEMTEMGAQALAASDCTVWCFVEYDDAQVLGAVGEGKAAAMVAGASESTADVFKKVIQAVLDAEINRERPLGEVAHNVAPALQNLALQRVYPGGNTDVDAEVIARASVETLAFWGMCPVAAPKLEEIGIPVPCDAQMEYDLDHRGRKGQRGKHGKDSTGKKEKKGKKGNDSTAA
ncbi:unnamed protein product [Closterium sp. Yama58-4]|nr:unnamed protein product [Closterium sp. Yama58-4]